MFTLLRNYKNMFMMMLQAGFEASNITEAEQQLIEAQEITRSTAEELRNFHAAMNHFGDESATLDKDVKNNKPAISKDIQELLALASKKLGNEAISAGKADGYFGSGTEAAVKAYQVAKGFDVTGIVTKEIYESLVNDSKINEYVAMEQERRTSSLLVVANFDWDNRADASEEQIKELQQALQDLGEPVNVIDGVVTPGGATERAYDSLIVEASQARLEGSQAALTQAQAALDTAAAALRSTNLDIQSTRDIITRLENEINNLRDTLKLVPPPAMPTIEGSISQLENQLRIAHEKLSRLLDEKVPSQVGVHSSAHNNLTQAQVDASEAASEHNEILRNSAISADNYARLEIQGEQTPESVKAALMADPEGKLLLAILQQDLKILGLYSGAIDAHKGVAYGFGPGVTRALASALEEHGDILSIRRAAKVSEVHQTAENLSSTTGRTQDGILLVDLSPEDGYTDGDFEKFLAQFKVSDAINAGLDPELQAHRGEGVRGIERRKQQVNAAIEMGDVRGSAGMDFVEGLTQVGSDRVREISLTLYNKFTTQSGKEELQRLMLEEGVPLEANDFVNGSTDAENYEPLVISGVVIDSRELSSIYIATGSSLTKDVDGTSQRGTVEVPIWLPDGSINPKFAELKFENAIYVDGAIVLTMGNGCEGNLAIIPVEKQLVPPTPPKPPKAPNTPKTPEITEDSSTVVEEECIPIYGAKYIRMTPEEFKEASKNNPLLAEQGYGNKYVGPDSCEPSNSVPDDNSNNSNNSGNLSVYTTPDAKGRGINGGTGLNGKTPDKTKNTGSRTGGGFKTDNKES